MKNKNILALLICIVFLAIATAGCSGGGSVDDEVYPNGSITMVIPYGAGGTTDIVGRKFAIALEKILSQKITVVNQPGASGTVAAQAVLNSEPDGYTVLFTADSLGSVRVLDIANISYNDFSAIISVANDPKVIVVNKDSKYQTIEDLIADAKNNPGQIKMSYTGPGGSGHVQSMIYSKAGLDFALTAYSGGNECLVAVLGEQVDFTNANYSTVAGYIESGDLRVLATSDTERLSSLPNVPALVEYLPELEELLSIPYTPLSLIVDKEVDEQVQTVLRDAAVEATKDKDFNLFMEQNSIEKLYEKYTTIDEINVFLKECESVVCWLMDDVGATKISPSEFGIEKP